MVKILKRIALVILLLAILVMLALWLFPIKRWVAEYVMQYAHQQGVEMLSLRIGDVSQTQMLLHDVVITQPVKAEIKSVRVTYDQESLIEGQVHDIVVDGLSLHVVLPKAPIDTKAEPMTIPFVPMDMVKRQLPFNNVQIKNADLNLDGKYLAFEMPFSASVESDGEHAPVVKVNAGEAVLRLGKEIVGLTDIQFLALMADEEKFVYTFKSYITQKNKEKPLLEKHALSIIAQADPDGMQLNFSLVKDENSPEKNMLVINLEGKSGSENLTVNFIAWGWNGGLVHVNSFPYSLSKGFSKGTTILVQKMPMQPVLDSISNGQIAATGTLNGNITIDVMDGRPQLGTGILRTDGPGTLKVTPEYVNILVRNNLQLQTVGEAFYDFRYSELEVPITSQGNGKTTIGLKLKGKNPEVYDGRPIHLNVAIGGALESMIRSSLQLQQIPDTLIQNLMGGE